MGHRTRALKRRLEPRVLGMVCLRGRALVRSVLYKKKKNKTKLGTLEKGQVRG